MTSFEPLKVVLASDGSTHSRAAEAILAALCWPPGSAATVLGVVRQQWSLLGLGLEGPTQVKDTLLRLQRVAVGAAQAVARQAAIELSQANLAVATAVLEGEPGDATLALAAELRADLIALGAQGFLQSAEPRLGSTAWQVLHEAPSSVLIARPGPHSRPARVILAADGLADWLPADAWPMALLPADTDVTIAKLAIEHDEYGAGAQPGCPTPVADGSDEAEMLALEFGEALQARGLAVRNIFPPGEPRAELVRLARSSRADLVIVGGRAMPAIDGEPQRPLATAVAKYAPCSVLVVQPQLSKSAHRSAVLGRTQLPARPPVETRGARYSALKSISAG
jgi:nucleotide-binding universal stress UspA family protein